MPKSHRSYISTRKDKVGCCKPKRIQFIKVVSFKNLGIQKDRGLNMCRGRKSMIYMEKNVDFMLVLK